MVMGGWLAGELDHEGRDAGVEVEGAVGGGVVVGGGEVDGVVGCGEEAAVVEALEVQGDADAGAAAGEGRVVDVEGCCADGHYSPINGRGGRECEMWRMETIMQGWILWPLLPVLVSTDWLLLSTEGYNIVAEG